MKRTILFVSIMLIVLCVNSQEPDWQWATQAGGSESDGSIGLAIDDNYNSYILGEFGETATFGSFSITSNGGGDVFVAKMDADGNWLWANSAGGYFGDNCIEIEIDNYGNSYIIGDFSAIATFGSYSITSNGERDVFVAKMDTDGNWLWAVQAGGSEDDRGYGIAVNDIGNITVTGWFREDATFGSYSLTSNGEDDIFVAKLDTDGNWLWVNQVGAVENDRGTAIVTGNTDDTYVTGYFRETVNFGAYSLSNIAGDDIFVAKLDTNGNWLWAVQAGGSESDCGYGIATDSNENCYVTGHFRDTAAFGSYSLTSSGDYDIFVAMLNADGNWIWTTNAGGSDYDLGWSITTDMNNDVYLTGSFREESTFGSYSLTSIGYDDIFLAKIVGLGDWLWVKQIGGVYFDRGYGIQVDDNFDCYLTGQFNATITLDSYTLTSYGEDDIFVAKTGNPSSVENEIITAKIELSNHPNPFNPSTTIQFSIQNNSNVELSIFNIKGQKIKTLAHNDFTKGSHSIVWNGDDESEKPVSSGIYLYKLNVNGKTEVIRKCLLLK